MRTPAAVRFAAPLLVLAAALAAPGRADDAAKEPAKIELRIAVKPGDVFHFRQTQHVVQSMKIGEMDIDSTIDTSQTMTYTVGAARADGLIDVDVANGDIKGTFENSMLGTFEIDSSNKDDASDNPMIGMALKQLTVMANRSYRVAFDARGRVAEVHGMKEILDEVLKSNPMFAGKAGPGGLVDDEGMKQQMQTQFPLFSDAPVAVGTKWATESGAGAAVAMKTEYTLASADDTKAVVRSKATVAKPADAASGKPATSVDCTITVARADGLALKSESKTSTVMDMAMGEGKAGADAQKMHMEMTVSVTLDRISADEAKAAPKKEPAPPHTPVAPPEAPPAPK